MSLQKYDLIVIGAGVAGLSAAKSALQAGLSTAVVEPLMFGGLVTNINELHGTISGSGADFASALMGEVADLGGEFVMTGVTGVERDGELFAVHTEEGVKRARAVVVASGARHRKLGVPGEDRLQERGVSHCADCDGPLHAGQDVAVIGGGDAALQEALVLAKMCRTVHLVHRSDTFRARRQFQEAVRASGTIQLHLNSRVEELCGAQALAGVRIVDTQTGGVLELSCRAVFPFVGLEPSSGFLPADVQRTESGLVSTDASLQTTVPGMFAAGAVRAGYSGQLSDALEEGRQAAAGAVARLAQAAATA
jgi:thioredoxin reductase (NADPH)